MLLWSLLERYLSTETGEFFQMDRRTFLASAAGAASIAVAGDAQSPNMNQTVAMHNTSISLGVATYSLRDFYRHKALLMLKELQPMGVVNVNVKDFHLPMSDSPTQLKAGVKAFTDAGFKIVAGGNVTMAKEEQLRPAFEYAKTCGFPVIVCIPTPETLPKVEELVKEFNIPVAIHNHGPEEKNFHSPYDVLSAIEKRDPRVGMCIDVGHTTRTGVDVAQAIADAGPRLLNVHVKDLANKNDRDSQVECGRGILPFRAIFAQLNKMGYKGSVDLEYEIHAEDPLPGMRESFAYLRGVLDGMKS
jgi:sugar phosphate isomerase/epimerase